MGLSNDGCVLRAAREMLLALGLLLAWGSGATAVENYSTATADAYVQARDWNRLLAYTRQWAQAEPQSAMAWYYLGNTLLNGFHQAAQAVAPLQRATTLKPDWADAWYFRGTAEMLAGRYTEAGSSLERAIGLNSNDTNYYMALVKVYELGIGAHQQAAVAPVLAYLVKLGQAGDANAQSLLGDMYHDGRGVPKNDTTAMQWYAKSAAQGHAYAEYSLGNGYMLGIGGLHEDQARATALFAAAAEKGLVDAQEAAAMSYEMGRGVSKDRAKAVYWAEKAAAQGDVFAGGFAKVLRNPHTPVFHSYGEAEGFFTAVFQYCWHDRFPVRRPDLDRPGYEMWQHFAPNWRDTYCH